MNVGKELERGLLLLLFFKQPSEIEGNALYFSDGALDPEPVRSRFEPNSRQVEKRERGLLGNV